MKPALLFLATFTLVGCGRVNPLGGAANSPSSSTLPEARKGFQTKPAGKKSPGDPVPDPPQKVFRKVDYTSPAGKLAAYVSPDPGDGKKHPAIVWITGGDCNTIGDVWHAGRESNDQTAAAYRKAGIVMMFPSLRGGNDNPGTKEAFLGEVDDVIAAADYLAKQDYVDPNRIYLGGHSTGGTLVLLVAESSDKFRAVFSFGPVEVVEGYGPEYLPFDTSNRKEIELRSPLKWLGGIKTPTFLIEGSNEGNADSLRAMQRASSNPMLHFLEIPGKTHFSVLAPANRVLAQKIVVDTGPKCDIALTKDEVK